MLSPLQIKSVFKASPFPTLVLHSDLLFTIAGANQAYLKVANSTETEFIGKSMMEAIGKDPENGNKERIADLKNSLEQVLITKAPHEMCVQQYKIPIKGFGKFETRYWVPVNTPVLNDDGEMDLIIHSLTDVTALKTDQILFQQELEGNQQILEKAYKLADIGTWEYDMLNHKLHWSPVTKEVHGFGQDYEPDLESTIKLFKEGFNRGAFAQAATEAIENEKPFDVELKIISGQGDERWVRATGEPEYKDGICTRFYGISQNVSVRRQVEEDLQSSEQRFKALVQDGSDLIAILDEKANYKYVSPTSERILGIPPERFIGTNAFDYIHVDDRERVVEHLSSLCSFKCIQVEPFRFTDFEGNWRWIESTITNMIDDPAVCGLVANSRDITEQKIRQQQLLDSIKEKETLLFEIHHRVKNNLAVISGLLQLQAYDIDDNSEVTDKLFDSVIRIKTMAKIHEQLYQSNSFSKLEFSDNLRLLVSDILKTFQPETMIDVKYHCEPLKMNMVQAIPCSLIVNEVITNILKHAFQGKREGDISIRLSKLDGKDIIILSIKDNGIGLPHNFESAESESLGMNLINNLSQQLKADYKFKSSDEGTIFTLQFEKAELKGIDNLINESPSH
ncbi:MAG: PAS domain S-box protein [Balneolales bacterium]